MKTQTIEQQIRLAINTNPEFLQWLRDVLFNDNGAHFLNRTINPSEGCQKWLTAKEVGIEVGMSAKWVKEHTHVLPPEDVRQKESGRREWWINFNENTRYLLNRAKTA